MLSGGTCQSIGSFEALRSLNFHFPILAAARSGDQDSPLSRFLTERVLNARNNFSAQLCVTEILQFNDHSHGIAILSEMDCKPGREAAKFKQAQLKLKNWEESFDQRGALDSCSPWE